MDDRDRDDYERRQAELELAGPDDDLIERYPGDRVPGTTDEFNYDDIVGRRAATLTLKFPARCAACDKPMAVGEESVGKKQGGRWLQFHPQHASQGTSTAQPVARLDPGERGFQLRYTQPCSRCHRPIPTGEHVASFKLEKGWDVRHLECAEM